MVTQDHIVKLANLTAVDKQFILRNLNQTMLLELLDYGIFIKKLMRGGV